MKKSISKQKNPEDITSGVVFNAKIEVKAYRDREGNPTCAIDFEKGDVCIFYRTQRMGCHETCVFATQGLRYDEMLKRRKNGEGTLMPLSKCPIWPTKIKKLVI